jgi:ABC-type multidrug transport system ATPase subunit
MVYMMMNTNIFLGFDYDRWCGYGLKEAVLTDISASKNSHTLICGMSGSGKSYLTNIYFTKLCFEEGNEGQVYFADFKQDDQFSHLRNCPRYYPYDKSQEALDTVYEILHRRQSGEDFSRRPITLIFDEYMAYVLALQGIDKKKADTVMRKVSEILMLGRSLAVRIVISCQRPDASAFPSGSRLNCRCSYQKYI